MNPIQKYIIIIVIYCHLFSIVFTSVVYSSFTQTQTIWQDSPVTPSIHILLHPTVLLLLAHLMFCSLCLLFHFQIFYCICYCQYSFIIRCLSFEFRSMQYKEHPLYFVFSLSITLHRLKINGIPIPRNHADRLLTTYFICFI